MKKLSFPIGSPPLIADFLYRQSPLLEYCNPIGFSFPGENSIHCSGKLKCATHREGASHSWERGSARGGNAVSCVVAAKSCVVAAVSYDVAVMNGSADTVSGNVSAVSYEVA